MRSNSQNITEDTLVAVMKHAAEFDSRGYTFLADDLTPSYWPFPGLVEEAKRRGRILQAAGLKKGDRVALVLPDSQEFVLTFLGAVYVGVVPVPMYPPLALNRIDQYMLSAKRILEVAGARRIITNKRLSQLLWGLVPKIKTLESVIISEELAAQTAPDSKDCVDVLILPEDTCFLQFTSGSTADPKGVTVSHKNLVANARSIMDDGLQSSGEDDVGVSWLPLYHDMGLIGFVIAPLYKTIRTIFIPTLTFVKRPNVWMETMSNYEGSITFAPNFAFGLAAKRIRPEAAAKLNLSKVRVVGCGAEPINPVTMREFVEAFKPAGLNPNAVMPAYGMAEATLAMAFDSVTRPFQTITIDRKIYETEHRVVKVSGNHEPSEIIELVSCGRTLGPHELGVMSDDGKLLPEGQVGELVFEGPSVTPGYFQNVEATQAIFEGTWLRTGDLGFILEGEVYVSGRKKDIIIVNGRNYYPQAIEWTIEHIEGIRRGNVAAFSVSGENSEELVVVAEVKPALVGSEALAADIRKEIKTQLGLKIKDIRLLKSGTLPKTSSGKLQRRKTRELYLQNKLEKQASRRLSDSVTRLAVAKHVTASTFAKVRTRISALLPFRMDRYNAG